MALDGFLDKMTDNRIMGNLEKAVIEVIDMRGRQIIREAAVDAGGSAGGERASGLNPGLNNIRKLNTSLTYAGAAAITDSVLDMGGLQSRQEGASLIQSLQGASRKLFHVQFNPSELSFSGYGGGMSGKTDFTGGNGISFESVKVRITMDVTLIFDKVDPQNAFMADKLNLAPTELATGAVKAYQTKKGTKDQSVQTEVEGFIAALRSPQTRRITFHWGKLTYTGILSKLSAQYKMFNVLGQPIRAEVKLSLVCADEEVTPNHMGIWQRYYEEAFGQKGNQSFVSSAQKKGNFINFNL